MDMRYALVAVFALPLAAQFASLAVTDDGRLYFSTQLRHDSLAPTDDRSKIIRLENGALALHGDAGSRVESLPAFFDLQAIWPVVSGDGSITGYGVSRPCMSGSCGLSGLPRTTFRFRGAAIPDQLTDYVSLSRNGAYLAVAANAFNGARIINTGTGATVELPRERRLPANLFSISDSGSYLAFEFTACVTRGNGEAGRLLLYALDPKAEAVEIASCTNDARLSPDTRFIAMERWTGERLELVLTGGKGENPRVLASAAASSYRFRSAFANDGAMIWIEPSRVMHLLPGGEPQILFDRPAREAVLSGDGQTAWIVSTAGELLRITTSSRAVETVVPPTPVHYTDSVSGAPGSVAHLDSLSKLAGVEVLAEGLSFPVTKATEFRTSVQIPWEFPAVDRAVPMVIRGPGNPFFRSISFTPFSRSVVRFERDLRPPAFANQLQAAHQDFRGVVSSRDPAAAGETIHIFARDMGPVDKPLRTGEAAPIEEPARVTTPMACYLLHRDSGRYEGLVVPFAGLSGGSVGVYQIDVTIPVDWLAGPSVVSCIMNDVLDSGVIEVR